MQGTTELPLYPSFLCTSLCEHALLHPLLHAAYLRPLVVRLQTLRTPDAGYVGAQPRAGPVASSSHHRVDSQHRHHRDNRSPSPHTRHEIAGTLASSRRAPVSNSM
ncbi:hypothetical protein BC629DRAFT_926119 [Irpex lacteus]|nr:hypothetical protein BC629DRAFT_926119 [Irpex lacteus]